MKALIIAAGDGTRMQPVTRGRHKSLMPLLGLRIIERVILAAKEAGILDFVIVTGYKGRELQETVGDGSRYGVSITYVQNDNWEKANGISALCAEKCFNENFVLLMSDHVFDPETLARIKRLKLKDKECALAIDRKLDGVLDVFDTTKVVLKNGKVEKIGKNLEKYNAYDTGMFICSPYIFRVLKKTTGQGKNSLTNAMSVLASEGRLRILDIKDKFWADCDTYSDIKFAEKKLINTLPKSTDYFIARNFNRKVSTRITKFLSRTSLTPNMISFSILILAVFTAFLLMQGVYPWILIGGVLIQLISILDGCDGEVARLKYIKSKWGAWFDGAIDKYVDTFIVVGLAYGYWNLSGNSFIWFIAIFVLLGLITDSYMHMKFKRVVGDTVKWRGLGVERDMWMLILAIGAVTNQVFFAMIFLLISMHIKVIGRLVTAKKVSGQALNSLVIPSSN